MKKDSDFENTKVLTNSLNKDLLYNSVCRRLNRIWDFRSKDPSLLNCIFEEVCNINRKGEKHNDTQIHPTGVTMTPSTRGEDV